MKKSRLINLSFFLSFLIVCVGCNNRDIVSEYKTIGKDPDFTYITDSTHLHEGIISLKNKEYEQARNHFLLSSQSSHLTIKTESFLYLNTLEIELKNYSQASQYLEEYHRNAMLLFKRAMDAENEINNHKNSIYQAINRFDRQRNTTYLIFLIFLVGIVIFGIGITFYYRSKKKKTHMYIERKQYELHEINSTIESNQKKSKSLKYNSYLILADTFMKTSIYHEISVLGEQKKTNDIKILSYARQEILNKEINKVFHEFIQELKHLDANLTDNDIKLCCLSLLPINSLAKAICYGSTEVNIIKQRKYQIKKKILINPENKPLFEFIFVSRDASN